MNEEATQRAALNTTAFLLAVVSVLHAARYVCRIKISVNDRYEIPLSASVPAALVTAALAAWMKRAAHKIQER